MSTPRFRWLVRQEMQFDEHGEPAGYAEVKVLQYATEQVEFDSHVGFQVYRLTWHDVPTAHDE